jgi:membrane-bound lytic murein transglycosylase A
VHRINVRLLKKFGQLTMSYQRFTILVTFYFLYSCARLEVAPQKAARVSDKSVWIDEGSTSGFKEALDNTISSLKKSNKRNIQLGKSRISKSVYLKSLLALKSCSKTKRSYITFIEKYFEAHTVYGKDHWGEILMTSYYEPVLKGSKNKTSKYSTAILAPPKNLVEIKLNQFENGDYGLESLPKKSMSAQVTTSKAGQKQITPLPSRKEIDFNGALKNKNLEIVYADPIDTFFLHIQGSGIVELASGEEIRLGYAAQNGRKYEAIGKFMKDKIKPHEMSMQKIEEVLRSEGKTYTKSIFSKNPSYVFFQKLKGRSQTTLGTEVTDLRTIAVDDRYFPLGLLAHISYPIPDTPPEKLTKKSPRKEHFVFAQDTGGAIKGPGRADLFWGRGEKAKQLAGKMRHPAKLYFFLPKKATTENLDSLYCKN